MMMMMMMIIGCKKYNCGLWRRHNANGLYIIYINNIVIPSSFVGWTSKKLGSFTTKKALCFFVPPRSFEKNLNTKTSICSQERSSHPTFLQLKPHQEKNGSRGLQLSGWLLHGCWAGQGAGTCAAVQHSNAATSASRIATQGGFPVRVSILFVFLWRTCQVLDCQHKTLILLVSISIQCILFVYIHVPMIPHICLAYWYSTLCMFTIVYPSIGQSWIQSFNWSHPSGQHKGAIGAIGKYPQNEHPGSPWPPFVLGWFPNHHYLSMFGSNKWAKEKKNSYFPLYCLVNRDPYNGLFQYSPYNCFFFIPWLYPKQPGALFSLRSCQNQANQREWDCVAVAPNCWDPGIPNQFFRPQLSHLQGGVNSKMLYIIYIYIYM